MLKIQSLNPLSKVENRWLFSIFIFSLRTFLPKPCYRHTKRINNPLSSIGYRLNYRPGQYWKHSRITHHQQTHCRLKLFLCHLKSRLLITGHITLPPTQLNSYSKLLTVFDFLKNPHKSSWRQNQRINCDSLAIAFTASGLPDRSKCTVAYTGPTYRD